MNVLVLQPDSPWMQRILTRLEMTSAHIWPAETWTRALEIMHAQRPDVMVIDQRVLQREGGDILAAIKDLDPAPIILSLTATPADAEATLKRLHLIITRLQGVFLPSGDLIRVGKLTIDAGRKEIIFAARRIRLPPIEFRLLQYLALNANRVVDQQELLREVWGYKASDIEARDLVKAHVRHIRRKLGWSEDDPGSYLKTVRGFGYTLSVPRQDRIRRSKERSTPTPQAEG